METVTRSCFSCTDQLTAEFISARTGLASVAVSSKSKQLGTWRISNYTPEFRETSGVGKRPVLTPDEVLRLPLDQALIIIRGKKVLQVDKWITPNTRKPSTCVPAKHLPMYRNGAAWKKKPPNTAARAETGSCSKETGKAQSHQTGIPH